MPDRPTSFPRPTSHRVAPVPSALPTDGERIARLGGPHPLTGPAPGCPEPRCGAAPGTGARPCRENYRLTGLRARLAPGRVPHTAVDIHRDADAAAIVRAHDGGDELVPAVRLDGERWFSNPSYRDLRAAMSG